MPELKSTLEAHRQSSPWRYVAVKIYGLVKLIRSKLIWYPTELAAIATGDLADRNLHVVPTSSTSCTWKYRDTEFICFKEFAGRPKFVFKTHIFTLSRWKRRTREREIERAQSEIHSKIRNLIEHHTRVRNQILELFEYEVQGPIGLD